LGENRGPWKKKGLIGEKGRKRHSRQQGGRIGSFGGDQAVWGR